MNTKRILVLGSGPDAALLAEALRSIAGYETYGLVTPEHPDPPPTTPEMVYPSDVPFKELKKSAGGPKPNPYAMPEKFVSMRVKNRSRGDE